MQGRGELGVKTFRGLHTAHVGFSWRLWLVGRRGIRRYAPTTVTALTALSTLYLRSKKFLSRFYAFCSAHFGLSVFYAN